MTPYQSDCGLYSPYALEATRQMLVAIYLMGTCWWLGLALGNMNGWAEREAGRQSKAASWLPVIASVWMVGSPVALLFARWMGAAV